MEETFFFLKKINISFLLSEIHALILTTFSQMQEEKELLDLVRVNLFNLLFFFFNPFTPFSSEDMLNLLFSFFPYILILTVSAGSFISPLDMLKLFL